MKLEQIRKQAQEIRKYALTAIYNANSGHPGGSLSSADILAVLYFGGILKHNPANPTDINRDYLVISKGHISPAVYATLGMAKYFDVNEFVRDFRQLGKAYQGHIDRRRVPGVEISTGSLGQGLSMAGGIALGLRLKKQDNHVFALLSDGELQEGQTWEAIMSSNHYSLNNLTMIIDRNRIQLDGYTEQTMTIEPLSDKLKAFGWNIIEINGHNHEEIYNALSKAKEKNTEKPIAIIANTIKGKGVDFMEDQVSWHGKAPSKEQLDLALEQLNKNI